MRETTRYKTLVARAESLQRIMQAIPAIERIGGQVEIAPPNKNGMVVVTLHLPPGAYPATFFPELSFVPA